jgi:hypothetical protein
MSTLGSDISGFNWGGALGGMASAIGNAVATGANSLAGALVSSAQSAVGNIAGAIGSAFSGIQLHGHVPAIPVILPNGFDFAEGGYFPGKTGGYTVNVGEAGDEIVLPRKYFGGIDPSILAMFGVPTSMRQPTTAAVPMAKSGTTNETHYHTQVIVDSENITRKVFKAFQDLEDYHHLLQ